MSQTAGPTINSFVLFPERDITDTPDALGMSAVDIETTNEAGNRLHGWFIAPPGAGKAVVLISHGNAGNVGSFLPWAKLLTEAGYAAALYDYQGYGRSEGDADVGSLAGDGRAAMRWLIDNDHLAGRPLGLLGLSLGTLVSVKLAGEFEQVSAVALEGALIPGEELKRKFGVLGAPIAWVLVNQIPGELDTAAHIDAVNAPLLFIHSERDEVTSIEGARDLFDKAPEPKQWTIAPGCAHLSPIIDWPEYGQTLLTFFDQHLP
jgi:hypothetical protein